jgi:MOSC domain-containing protein YiiM
MKVLALHTGAARDITATGTGEWWDKDWRSGFVKASQLGSVWLGYEGFSGDEQADRKHHGGVEKAVCVYPVEHYLYWQEVLPGLDLPHGAFGENLTTSGLLESGVSVGDVYQLGDAMVQVSQPRQPCWKLARRWRVKDLSAQVERTGYTGFYFRVLRHGHVAAGNELELKDRPWPQWTLQRCNEIMHHQRQDAESARQLAECPALSGSWKDNLWRRAQSAGAGGAGEAARRTARLEG